ncbi:hypothetical protein EWM64_g2148 [Hericium alpestre]|uniref:Uncharacterized protein n=1 Tax=Hericium alpestre TaxID=135208 RepID=A0A4Z0A8E0_9AGAM|nr:hypothetical protein EWM64_g2148 [Hericium alpestre]
MPNKTLARAWSAASNDNLIPIHLWSGGRRAVPFPAIAAPTSAETTPATSDAGAVSPSTLASTLVSPVTSQDTLVENGVKTEDWKSADAIVDALGKPSVDILQKLARTLVGRAILDHAKARETATLAGAITKVINERWLAEMAHVFAGAVRIATLLRMKAHWSAAGGHIMAYADAASYEMLMDQGTIMAEFLGCLFANGIVTSDDIFLATCWLMQPPTALGRVQALHVLIDAYGKDFASERTADWLWNLRNCISFRMEDGQYYWGMGGRANGLVEGIRDTIDDWFSGQTKEILDDKPCSPFLSPPKVREGQRNIWRWYQAVSIVPRDDDWRSKLWC